MSSTKLNPTRFSNAAAQGLRVFPAKSAGKEPALPWKQFQEEPPTADQIAGWDTSTYNVCIVTGAPSGIVVVDVDSPEGQALIDSLDLPPTPTVRTARGCHLYFLHPGYHFPNLVKVQGLKVDVRGDGGYVIGAGSVHPSGVTYEWIVSPDEAPFATLPEQLLALLKMPKKLKKTKTAQSEDEPGAPDTGVPGLDAYLLDELAKARDEVADAAEGERNDTLFKMAARIARHVSAAGADWPLFADALAEAAQSAGLEEGEIAGTLESGWKTGSAEPTLWISVAREHVYLAFQERFYHVPSATDLRPAGFNGQYGHVYRGKGTLANFLLLSDCIRKVHDVAYEPLDRRRFIDRHGLEMLNTFKPSSVTPVEGDPTPFVDFLSALIPDQAERDHLLRMMAYTVRNPGMKLRYALLLRTAVQGVGKTMFADIWGGLLGPHNVRKTTPKELAGDFQGYLREKLLVVCEEMNLGMGFRAYNDLKDMVTADIALVNEKHLRQRECPIYATFVFLTNLEQSLLIEVDDRRFFCIDSPAQKREPDYYKGFARWWNVNLGVIRNYLESIDLADFNAHEAPPMTESKRRLIAGSRSELAQELALAIAERHGRFDRDLVTLEEVAFSLGTPGHLRSKPKLVKALKEVGAVSLGQQRVAGSGRASLWAIRNLGYWRFAEVTARVDELSQATGMFAGLDELGIDVVYVSLWPADEALLFLPTPANSPGEPDEDEEDAAEPSGCLGPQ